MGKTVPTPPELRHFLEMPEQIEQFRHCHAIKLHKFVQEVSTSAARFFAAATGGEPLLVLFSLSLCGVSLRLSGLLA